MHDQIKAGAQDAARQLNLRLTGSGLRDASDDEAVYTFRFATGDRQHASVEFLAEYETVRASGLTPRDYARLEILDALNGHEP